MEVTWGKLVLGVAALVVVPIVAVKGCAFREAVRLRAEAPRLCVVPSTKAPAGAPYLRGRVAVVNQEQKWDFLIGNYLPKDLAATKPEEITTCVVLDWNWKATGVFDVTTTTLRGGQEVQKSKSKELARAQTCHVTIVDLSIPAIVGEAEFVGRTPEGFVSDGTGDTDPALGGKPISEVEEWLHGLPRKP